MIPGWKQELEHEYLETLRSAHTASPAELAAQLGVSECCVVYWLTELAREGRVRILSVVLVKDGQAPCADESFLRCERKTTCPAAPALTGIPVT